MTGQIECWSVILTDQARDVILSTAIDCKITNFSLYLFFLLFCNNYNIGELTSTTSKERMTTNNIFASATPIN